MKRRGFHVFMLLVGGAMLSVAAYGLSMGMKLWTLFIAGTVLVILSASLER